VNSLAELNCVQFLREAFSAVDSLFAKALKYWGSLLCTSRHSLLSALLRATRPSTTTAWWTGLPAHLQQLAEASSDFAGKSYPRPTTETLLAEQARITTQYLRRLLAFLEEAARQEERMLLISLLSAFPEPLEFAIYVIAREHRPSPRFEIAYEYVVLGLTCLSREQTFFQHTNLALIRRCSRIGLLHCTFHYSYYSCSPPPPRRLFKLFRLGL